VEPHSAVPRDFLPLEKTERNIMADTTSPTTTGTNTPTVTAGGATGGTPPTTAPTSTPGATGATGGGTPSLAPAAAAGATGTTPATTPATTPTTPATPTPAPSPTPAAPSDAKPGSPTPATPVDAKPASNGSDPASTGLTDSVSLKECEGPSSAWVDRFWRLSARGIFLMIERVLDAISDALTPDDEMPDAAPAVASSRRAKSA